MRDYDNVVTLNTEQVREYRRAKHRINVLKAYGRLACQIIGTAGALLVFGTVGALDTELISLTQGMVQGGIGSVLTIGCYLIYGKLS